MPIYDEQMRLEDVSDEYKAFVDKFKPKKTTDDCYTPENVYNAVAGWACREYGFNRADIVRPFWPGGDYERFDYPEDCVVVDNPPFSILAKIVAFYQRHGVPFFLFAPALPLCGYLREPGVTAVATGSTITYANGAEVITSFLTNMEPDVALRTAPDLWADIKAENDKNNKKPALPVYEYPAHVITAAACQRLTHYGVDFRVRRSECAFVRSLDAQRAKGKAIFGSGLLLSDHAAAARETAEIEADREREREREKRFAAGLYQPGSDGSSTAWPLSNRERQIVEALNKQKEAKKNETKNLPCRQNNRQPEL